jgi:hypothetical protein
MRWRLILFHSAHDEHNPQITDTLLVMFLQQPADAPACFIILVAPQLVKICFLG